MHPRSPWRVTLRRAALGGPRRVERTRARRGWRVNSRRPSPASAACRTGRAAADASAGTSPPWLPLEGPHPSRLNGRGLSAATVLGPRLVAAVSGRPVHASAPRLCRGPARIGRSSIVVTYRTVESSRHDRAEPDGSGGCIDPPPRGRRNHAERTRASRVSEGAATTRCRVIYERSERGIEPFAGSLAPPFAGSLAPGDLESSGLPPHPRWYRPFRPVQRDDGHPDERSEP